MKHPQTYGAAVLAVALITPFAFAQDKLPSRSTPWVQVIKKTIDGVVAIRVPSPNGERDMIGSGVLFQQDENGAAYIVTNRHVTGGKRQLKIRLNDGTDLSGEVMLTEPDLDLAIVKFKPAPKNSQSCLAPRISRSAKRSSPSAARSATKSVSAASSTV